MSPRRASLSLAFSVLATVFATSLPACSSAPDDEADAMDQDLASTQSKFGPITFRNHLYTYLKEDGYSDDDVRKLILLPNTAVLKPAIGAVDPNAPLRGYDEAFKSIRPMDLYNEGLKTKLTKLTAPGGGRLESVLHRHPVHIVVVPGIFGEFIPVSPFEEVFAQPTTAAARWNAKLHSLEVSKDPAALALTHDKAFSAQKVADVERPMRDLMRVGSIDEEDGTPLVTVTYLKPDVGSLETFGTLEENNKYYLSRLEKYFKIIGVPDELYIMGYSRGTATALDLIAHASEEKASWLPNLRGMVGLAGVVYGSQLADAAREGGPQKEGIDTLTDFVTNKLESCTGPTPGAWLVTKNLGHWTAFAGRMAWIAANMPEGHADVLEREGIDPAGRDFAKFFSFIKRVLLGDPQHVMNGEDESTTMLGVLQLGSPNAQYCQNIDRFKRTAVQILKGVDTLTTRSRLEWWRTHELPTRVRYYALTGTMGDATPEGAQPTPLVKFDRAYDTQSLDFQSLRSNYYDLLAASGTQLQDSQVPVQRGRFWPQLHGVLNPRQGELATHFLGTLGEHHWGLSFPRAFSTKDGRTANPFPRTTLLKAIATFAMQVELTEGRRHD